MGGRASFAANAVLPLKAAISYYGAGITKMLPLARDQHGPILLFWGGKDAHIGRDQQIAVADALRSAGKTFSDVEFSDADHGFFCDVRKSYNPVAARESWALLTEFFKEHLGS
jgi:carboxymethylenebutenolidase